MSTRNPPPPPIRVPPSRNNMRSPSRLAGANDSPSKLLYELPPSAASTPRRIRSPPPQSPSSRLRSLSPPPLSPPDQRRTSFGAALQMRPTKSSVNGQETPMHSASAVLLEPQQSDLDVFAASCRAWYYDQDAVAGRQMSQTLATAPPSHRATYTRLQASIRSQFHADQALRRITEFRALLSSTEPGNSLTPASRANPTGNTARKERIDKLGRFIRAQCLSSIPGTHPFFTGLYGILRLQALPERLGGAGERVIEWEIDDAVFLESAGKDFTTEAIDVLKGVLGFTEAFTSFSGSLSRLASPSSSDLGDFMNDESLPTPTPMHRISPPASYDGSPNERQPRLLSTPSSRNIHPSQLRARAPSDPFIDHDDASGMSPSMSAGSAPGLSVAPTTSTLSSSPDDQDAESTGPITPQDSQHLIPPTSLSPSSVYYSSSKRPPRPRTAESIMSEPALRTWTIPPTYTNPELHELMALFPAFITQRAISRFPVLSKPKSKPQKKSNSDGPTPALMEAGLAPGADGDGVEIRVGTGQMRKSGATRVNGWRGGFWARMMEWLRSMFG